MLGPIISLRLNVPFFPIRKAGKLPGEVIAESMTKEYGKDVLEIQASSISLNSKVVIFDDLLATGGTACAAEKLVSKLGGEVVLFLFIIRIKELKGEKGLKGKVYSILNK